MDLLELRNELDGIDKQIVELYEKRMNVCGQVAEYKIETGKRVFDKEREKQKLEAVRALTHNDFNAYGVTELFEQKNMKLEITLPDQCLSRLWR